jgi:hypothetical protein
MCKKIYSFFVNFVSSYVRKSYMHKICLINSCILLKQIIYTNNGNKLGKGHPSGKKKKGKKMCSKLGSII